MTPFPPEHSAATPGALLHLPQKDLETTVAMLEANGCDLWRIELDGTTDKTELFTRIASALIFPDWFGHNWDALADCLGDLSWLPAARKRALLFTGLDTTSPNGQTLLELLTDLADDIPVAWLSVTPCSPSIAP